MTVTQKQWSLLAAALLATGGYAAAVSVALSGGAPVAAVIIVLLAVPWAALIASIVTLLTAAQVAVLVAAAAAAASIAGRLQPEAFAAALLVALLIGLAARRIQQETVSHIRFAIRHIYYRPVQLLLLAAVLMAAGPAFDRLKQYISADGLRLPEPSLVSVTLPLEHYLAAIIPGYHNDATVEDVAETQLQQAGETRPLTEDERRQLEGQLTSQLGQPVSAGDPLPVVVARGVNEYIARLSRQSPLLSALFVIVVAATAVRAALPLLAWPSLSLITGLTAVARRWHIIYRLEEERAVERLVLKP